MKRPTQQTRLKQAETALPSCHEMSSQVYPCIFLLSIKTGLGKITIILAPTISAFFVVHKKHVMSVSGDPNICLVHYSPDACL